MPDFIDPLEAFLHEQQESASTQRQEQQQVRSSFRHGPSIQQRTLPGLGQAEQMRLFDTQKVGPANVYRANTSPEATDWRDQDVPTQLSPRKQKELDDDEYGVLGQFFRFPLGPEARSHVVHGSVHTRTLREAKEDGTYLGHDAYPERVHPDLTVDDLENDDYGDDEWTEQFRGQSSTEQTNWFAPDGTLVGRVEHHDDEWGPQVDHAEINPLYRGRGFARDNIAEFADMYAGGGRGIVHAGGYTADGSKAFHARGIPTETDIEYMYDAWRENLDVDQDDLEELIDIQLYDQGRNPDSPEEREAIRDAAESRLRENYRDGGGPHSREVFLDTLEESQEHVLANIPGRRSAFMDGWKPKRVRGTNVELPGMPPR